MDAQLKQRVVGAAVLVALGVIFIPLMLDNGNDTDPAVDLGIEVERPADFNSRVVPIDDDTMDRVEEAMDAEPPEIAVPADAAPPVPDAPEPVVEAAPVPEAAAEAPPAEPAAAAQARPAAAVEPEPTRTGVTAWVVQLGSFSATNNAEALVERLKKEGYTAFIEPLHQDGKTSYRVRVGPELTKVIADRIRDELAEKTGLKGIVMRYP